MREKPILFSGPMVRAILEGRKTQTRRGLKGLTGLGRRLTEVTEFQKTDTPGYEFIMRDRNGVWNDFRPKELFAACPYGQPGDRLWVRESLLNVGDGDWQYSADGAWLKTPKGGLPGRWATKSAVPSIHMPRHLSRITLEVTDVRVQRLQDISEKDARAEGVEYEAGWESQGPDDPCYGFLDYLSEDDAFSFTDPRDSFGSLWTSINGEGSWGANPWVWAITFKRI